MTSLVSPHPYRFIVQFHDSDSNKKKRMLHQSKRRQAMPVDQHRPSLTQPQKFYFLDRHIVQLSVVLKISLDMNANHIYASSKFQLLC